MPPAPAVEASASAASRPPTVISPDATMTPAGGSTLTDGETRNETVVSASMVSSPKEKTPMSGPDAWATSSKPTPSASPSPQDRTVVRIGAVSAIRRIWPYWVSST